MGHLLEADSIILDFGNRRVLSDIYIKCESGKITSLLGRNGQGKSCLMKIIYGSLKCENSLRIDNFPIKEAYKRPELITFLPQSHFIPRHLSLKRIFRDYGLDHDSFLAFFPAFKNKAHFPIGKLSGGDLRLVEIYIVVKSNSLFSMLDEPFTHLSPINIEKVKAFLVEEKQNKGILITDHMYRHLTEISDMVYVLTDGKSYSARDQSDIERLGYARF